MTIRWRHDSTIINDFFYTTGKCPAILTTRQLFQFITITLKDIDYDEKEETILDQILKDILLEKQFNILQTVDDQHKARQREEVEESK